MIVSIPYRHSKNTHTCHPLAEGTMTVSIPYRHSKNFTITKHLQIIDNSFQFLIGTLKTEIRAEPDNILIKFQFLIGTLKT